MSTPHLRSFFSMAWRMPSISCWCASLLLYLQVQGGAGLLGEAGCACGWPMHLAWPVRSAHARSALAAAGQRFSSLPKLAAPEAAAGAAAAVACRACAACSLRVSKSAQPMPHPPGCMHAHDDPGGQVAVNAAQVLLQPAPLLAVLVVLGVAAQHDDVGGANVHRVVQLAAAGALQGRGRQHDEVGGIEIHGGSAACCRCCPAWEQQLLRVLPRCSKDRCCWHRAREQLSAHAVLAAAPVHGASGSGRCAVITCCACMIAPITCGVLNRLR